MTDNNHRIKKRVPCDCREHPDFPERCSPTRGHYDCSGRYRMPEIPSDMICVILGREQ